MILIVGLGNPGKEYEFTRHNIGFKIIDKFTDSFEKKSFYRKFSSLVFESSYNNHKIIILKPQTFMNRSGSAVALCYKFFKNQINSILVIHDDIDIKFGEIKLKRQEAADYVLEEFNIKEKEEVEIGINKSVDIIRDYIREGIEYAMNKYN